MFKLNHKLMEKEIAPEVSPVGGAPVEGAPVGGGSGQWYDTFAEDIRSNQNVTKFGSAEELAKSYINAQNLIGRDKIPMPVTDDDWANTYARLGRPEEAAGYKFNTPEGAVVNEERQGAFRELAHQIGLSQKQAEALAAFDFEGQAASFEQSTLAEKQATAEAVDSLKKEWGGAFEQNTAIANRAITEFAGEEGLNFLKEVELDGVSLADHPAVVKMFNNIGKGLMEGGNLKGVGSDLAMTPDEIQAKQASLMAHTAYTDRSHPEHISIKKQVEALFKLQFPN